MRGTVKWYNETKGFGFITREGENDIFVHRSGLKNSFGALDEGQEVEFEVEEGEKGLQAINVEVVG
ncbi:MAG: cold shock domain-containing protein [Salinivirgaceae bacterium]|nr:cold shock domain-containing protein [Salinivirgaceae bacterium]